MTSHVYVERPALCGPGPLTHGAGGEGTGGRGLCEDRGRGAPWEAPLPLGAKRSCSRPGSSVSQKSRVCAFTALALPLAGLPLLTGRRDPRPRPRPTDDMINGF